MGYKVLVIDDSPFIFKAVKRAMEPEGFEMVGQAFNGQEGLEMEAQFRPDLIILDVTMPIMDGLKTAEHLYRKNPAANIIMLSAIGDEKLIQDAKTIGVKRFLTKPFKPEELISVVRELF